MYVTVFRLRLNPDPQVQEEYKRWAMRLNEVAPKMPGYRSHKRFIADDGERCTIVEFDSEEGHNAWATHPEHVAAKDLGRSTFFTEYNIKICELKKELAKP